jgi:hypothetical protein
MACANEFAKCIGLEGDRARVGNGAEHSLSARYASARSVNAKAMAAPQEFIVEPYTEECCKTWDTGSPHAGTRVVSRFARTPRAWIVIRVDGRSSFFSSFFPLKMDVLGRDGRAEAR